MFLTKELRLQLVRDLRWQCSADLSIIPSEAIESWSHFSTSSHHVLVGGATWRLPPPTLTVPTGKKKKKTTLVLSSWWCSGLTWTRSMLLQRSRWDVPAVHHWNSRGWCLQLCEGLFPSQCVLLANSTFCCLLESNLFLWIHWLPFRY